METTVFNLGIILTSEDMALLKGGVAETTKISEDPSASGDGAEYVCCIKIKLP